MTRMPLKTKGAVLVADASGFIVAEGQAIPISALSFAGPTLDEHRAAAMVVVSSELLRATSASGRALLDNSLKAGVAAALDAKFLAIIGDGVTPISASGTTAAAALSDLHTMLDAVNKTGSGALFFVASPDVANAAAVLTSASGDLLFSGMGPLGGELIGAPALVANALPAGTIMLVDASGLAGEIDNIAIGVTDQATLQFDTAPDSPPIAATVMQSLWQSNRSAILATAYFGAEVVRPGSVAVLDGVNWGSA